MSGIPLILMFILSMAGMILVLFKIRIHPFVTLLGISLLFGIIAGIPLANIPGVLGAGFSGIFTGIGIVVIFGILIGNILDVTGGAIKIADMAVRLIGRGSPTLAFMLMGWLVSISLYCDSGFVVLNPARKSAVKHAGTGSVATTMGLGSGLYISHALIPFTPGPLAVSGLLGLGDNLIMVLVAAVAVSVPALVGAYFYSVHMGKKKRTKEDIRAARDETTRSYGRIVKKYKKLPSGSLALSPILVPILLMTLGAVADGTGFGGEIAVFLGTPVMAMIVALLFSIVLLVRTGKMKEFNPATENTLKSAGPILCVTGAGGVLGRVIAESGVIEAMTANTAMFQNLGIFFPFLIAAVVKTAQGSSTVAMVTAAGITVPLMASLGLDSAIMSALTVTAIGTGSMIASHVNDPYFWIVTKLSGMSPRQGYMTHTMVTIVAGLSGMAGVLIFSLFAR